MAGKNGAIKLVAGNSNPALAQQISDYLKTSPAKAVVKRFADMEVFVEIHENVRGGVAYLADLQELFHGDLRLVMAAYAAGEGPVLARGLDYSSQEVYTYVQRIGQQYRAELRRRGRK